MWSNESQGGNRLESDRAAVRAIVERYRDKPDQCTMFPENVDDEERSTTWITAKAPFYLNPWEHR